MAALSGITPPVTTAPRKNAWRLLALFAVLGTAAGVIWAGAAHAGTVDEWIATNIIGPIIILLVGFIGQLLLIMVGVLISIAKYNDFVGSTAVANGWVIVRDVTNMFFILVLLVLAFGTMLGVESYSYKNRMLPRLLIMAVVINFSRTICGLLIDFGQVVMLTFVNGFAAAAGGNFVEALKIREMLEPGEKRGGVNGWGLVIAALLALAMVSISLGVIIIMTATLVIRIIYLWLLVILSPIAFFMKAVPGGKASGYYAEWWSMFTSNIVTGPILAFFLWLSLVSVAAGGVTKNFPSPTGGEGVSNDSISKAFEGNQIQGYIISIGLLLGGVMMAQKAGGAGVGIGKSIAQGAGKAVARGAKAVGKGAWDRTGGRAVDAAKERVYAAGTYIPGLKTTAGRRLGELRQEKAGKAAEASKFISQLKPEEAARYAKSRVPLALMSNEQKAIQKEALRATLKKDAGGVNDKNAGDFRERMATFSKLGSETNDKSVVGDLGEIQKMRPDLIVDPNATGEARGKQEEAFGRIVSGMSARDLGKLNTSAMTPAVLANVNPKVLQKALESSDTGSAQRKALEAYANKGEPDLATKMAAAKTSEEKSDVMRAAFAAQQAKDKKERPDLIADADERTNVIRGMDDKDIAAFRPDQLSTAMLGSIAAAGKLDKVDTSKLKLDSNQLANNRELAGQIGVAMGDKIGKLPKDIAQALRTGLKESKTASPEQKLSGGVPVKDVFSSFNPRTGSFGNADQRKEFEKITSTASGALAAMKGMSAKDMTDRGALNEATVGAMANFGAPEMRKLVEGKNADQVFGAIQSAKFIKGTKPEVASSQFESSLPKDMDKGAKDAMVKSYQAKFKAAQAAANDLLEDMQNSTLGAEVKGLKFNVPKAALGASKQGLSQMNEGRKAIQNAVKDALGAVSSGIAEGATAAGQGVARGKRAMGRAIGRTTIK